MEPALRYSTFRGGEAGVATLSAGLCGGRRSPHYARFGFGPYFVVCGRGGPMVTIYSSRPWIAEGLRGAVRV